MVPQVKADPGPAEELHKILKKNRVYVGFGGGTGTFGTNFTVFHCNGTSIWIDTGAGFPDHHTPGLDKTLPSLFFLSAFPPSAIFLTHGHEDHIGAFPYLYDLIPENTPVYCSAFTGEMVKLKLKEFRLPEEKLKFQFLATNAELPLSAFSARIFFMNHSIPQTFSVALRHEASGRKYYFTSDFKIAGEDGRHDPEEIRSYGPVDHLFCDSTGSIFDGETAPESEVIRNLEQAIRDFPGRIFLTTFSSHIERIAHLFRIAEKCGRKVGIIGYSLKQSLKAAWKAGIFPLSPENLSDPSVSDAKGLWIVAGCQSDEGSSFWRLARNQGGRFNPGEGDLLIYSSSMIPGNEAMILESLNMLVRRGVQVAGLHDGKKLHSSGHGRAEDIRKLVSWLRPARLSPVHGDPWHFRAFERIRAETGGFTLDIVHNGMLYDITEKTAPAYLDESGPVFLERGEVHQDGNLYRTRNELRKDGVCIVVIEEKTGKVKSVKCVGVCSGNLLEKRYADLFAEVEFQVQSVFQGGSKKKEKKLREKLHTAVSGILKKSPYLEVITI